LYSGMTSNMSRQDNTHYLSHSGLVSCESAKHQQVK